MVIFSLNRIMDHYLWKGYPWLNYAFVQLLNWWRFIIIHETSIIMEIHNSITNMHNPIWIPTCQLSVSNASSAVHDSLSCIRTIFLPRKSNQEYCQLLVAVFVKIVIIFFMFPCITIIISPSVVVVVLLKSSDSLNPRQRPRDPFQQKAVCTNGRNLAKLNFA